MIAKKKEIRTQIRQKRKALPREEWLEKSHIICDSLRSQPDYQQADVIYAYLAKEGEVLLDELIEEALKRGKRVAVPKVLGESMEFYELNDLAQVESGCMGIREPLSRKTVQGEKPLMLLPAVAVDESLHRVGYGGGYYDRYLEQHPALRKIAVVFEFQVYPQVPAEVFDIRPDLAVTEYRILEQRMES